MDGFVRFRTFGLGAVLGAVPGVNLVDLGYRFFSLEVIGWTLIFTLSGAALGYLTARTRLYRLVFLIAAYWFFDVYFFNYELIAIDDPSNEWMVKAQFLLTVFVMAVAAIFWEPIELRFVMSVSVFALVFFLGGVLKTPRPIVEKSDVEATRVVGAGVPEKAIVHVILDEQGSPLLVPDFMDPDHPGLKFAEAFAANGYKVFGIANSHSLSTFHSLGALFKNVQRLGASQELGIGAKYSYRVEQNKMIERMFDAGYRVNVIQSSFLDICPDRNEVACHSYTRVAHMAVIERAGLAPIRRMKLAAQALHENYRSKVISRDIYVYRMFILELWKKVTGKERVTHGFFARPLVILEVMEDLGEKLQDIRPGDVYVAHLLMPHFPYVLDRDCELLPMSEWTNAVLKMNNKDQAPIYEGYWDQSFCTIKQLDKMLSPLADKDFVTVIIHGDHGARILLGTDEQNDEDNHGTFLAVRDPAFEPGLVTEPVDLIDEFWRAFDTVVPVGE